MTTQPMGAVDRRMRYADDIKSIYLAGKVATDDDWREEIVAYDPIYAQEQRVDLSHAHKSRYGGIVFDPDNWEPDAKSKRWPVRAKALFGRYDYTGPYVTNLGHCQNDFSYDYFNRSTGQTQRAFVVEQCLAAMHRSDLVFAWVDDLSAYGTFTELGYAKALGKRVWIAGPAEFEDLWFLYQLAERTSFGADTPPARCSRC